MTGSNWCGRLGAGLALLASVCSGGQARADEITYECTVGVPNTFEADFGPEERHAYEAAAWAGDVHAQYRLGLNLVRNGQREREEPLEGLFWLSKAATEDCVRAQIALATIFETGRILPRDMMQAIWWADQANAAGAEISDNQLRRLYPEGQFDFVGYALTAEQWAWYFDQADNGNHWAQWRLAADSIEETGLSD